MHCSKGKMDDPDITIEEYIWFKEEKARGHDFEEEFLVIVFKDVSMPKLEYPRKLIAWQIYQLRLRDIHGSDTRLREIHRRRTEGRKRGAQMSGGHFISRLANHFGLLTEESNCVSLGDTMGLRVDRDRDVLVRFVAAGALEVAEVAQVLKRVLRGDASVTGGLEAL
ncbi:hypothetical protein Tco_0168628 [Tanacetum coccineum]